MASSNARLYPWFQFFRNLLFWQATWFLFFQNELSPAEAVSLYAFFNIGTILTEVPSGYFSDRFGRRITLVLSSLMGAGSCLLIATGSGFFAFALAQILSGASFAFASGTDSALLYESLEQEDKAGETASHEMRSWRFTFTALAFSALAGGFMAAKAPSSVFAVTAVTATISMMIAARFQEPLHIDKHEQVLLIGQQVRAIKDALRNPLLVWFFLLSVGMYSFSHVVFVFGQPFIMAALDAIKLADKTAVISGAVSAAMMLASVAASWLAVPLHRKLGLKPLFLAALAVQIGLIAVLAVTIHPAAIALLLVRMVPDALARPFILANVQPLLQRRYRATYWSLQSLTGRLVLASSLLLTSTLIPLDNPLSHTSLQQILPWYIVTGLALLIGLTAMKRGWSHSK